MITKKFKLTLKSQVTIPDRVKEVLHIKSGDSVYFSIKNGHVEILPVRDEEISVFDLGAKYRTVPKQKVSVQDMNKAIKSQQQRRSRKNK